VKVTTSSFATGGVADYRPQRDRAVGYQRGQDAAADAFHRAAEELAEVDQMAADVAERAGSRAALVPPAHRGVLGEPVVAPVVAVEVHHRAEAAARDLLTDRVDGR
jgi:hypothetical protein